MYYDYNAFLDAAAADPRIMTMAQPYFGDPKFMYAAGIRNPQLFAFARPELLNYADLVFAIGEKQPGIIKHAGYGLRQDASFLLEFISRYPQAFAYLEEVNPILYHNIPFITALYQRNLDIANYASDDYKEKMLKDIPVDVVSRNGELIQIIMSLYNNLDFYKDNTLPLENYYDDLWNKYLDPMSKDDYNTLMAYEIDGKPLSYYDKKVVAFTCAGRIKRRIDQAQAGEKDREEDLKVQLEFIESEESYVTKEEVEEFYPKFGITKEMLKPYMKKKKKKASTAGGKKSGSSADLDDDLDRDDIELPTITGPDYPSDYTLSDMIVSNAAYAIDDALMDFRFVQRKRKECIEKKKAANRANPASVAASEAAEDAYFSSTFYYVKHVEDVMNLINYYRQYVSDFDAMLARTKSAIPGGSALELLKNLEREALVYVFEDLEYFELSKDRNKADELYNEAVECFDEDVVKNAFYSNKSRRSLFKKIDKRNGYKVKHSTPQDIHVEKGREVEGVALQLKRSLMAISSEMQKSRVIESQHEKQFLKLYNQTKEFIKVSPELGERLKKTKCDSTKYFFDKIYEMQYMFCQVHVFNISKYMSDGKYDKAADEFDYLVKEQYPIEMIKSLCNKYVLNFVSLKKITYGKLSELELHREANRRMHNNPVELVVEELREINDMHKKKKTRDIFKKFSKLESDFDSLSNEQLEYLEKSITIDGQSIFQCYWTNRLWVEAFEISRELKAGNKRGAYIIINKVFENAKKENYNIPLEWIKNAFSEFGLDEYYAEKIPKKKDEARETRPETKPIESTPDRSTASSSLEIDYMFISSQICSIYQHLMGTLTSYSAWCQKSIERIGDRIKSGVMKNPELKNKLEKEIEPGSGLTVMQIFMLSDCLNRLRLARESDDKALEDELAARYGDIYNECCNIVKGRS